MQVTLDPASGLVGGGNNAGPRGDQLSPRLGVGDRRRGQLGKVGQAGLGSAGSGLGGRRPDRPHSRPSTVIGHPRSAHTKLARHIGERAGGG